MLINNYGLSPSNAYIITSDPDMYKLFIQSADKGSIEGKTIADFLINKRYGDKLPKTSVQLLKSIANLAKSRVTDRELISDISKKVITANPKAVTDFKSGKGSALYFLLGQVKKELTDADVAVTGEILKKLLA